MVKPTTFLVCAMNKSDVLARVVLLFHRCAIDIDRLTMRRPKKSSVMRMSITVRVNTDQWNRLEAILHKLFDVLSVTK